MKRLFLMLVATLALKPVQKLVPNVAKKLFKSLFPSQQQLNYQQRLKRLRYFTVLFFTLLILPVGVVATIGFNQLEKDLLSQYQRQSEKVTSHINKRLFKRHVLSNGITASEFNYYQHLYNPENQQFTKALSPLANPEYYKRNDGLLGYFQLDQHGQFNSPVWPYAINQQMAISAEHTNAKNTHAKNPTMQAESVARKNLAHKLYNIASRSNEIQNIITKKLEVLSLENKYKKFRFVSDVPEYFIFYRVMNINHHPKLQGYILSRDIYIDIIENALDMVRFDAPITLTIEVEDPNDNKRYIFFRSSDQSPIKINHEILAQSTKDQATQLNEQSAQLLISRQNLIRPFENYIITYATDPLVLSSAAVYNITLMTILMLIIALGCYGFYRISVAQLKLAEQRLNFVSSVSHELKTPLTSIRMYSEMLKTGMLLSEQHRSEYYEFIHSESERLSRLIDNILQLSTLSRQHHSVKPQYIKLSILTDIIRSKVSSLVDNNDFTLNITHFFDAPDNVLLLVDVDAFSQVVINITDNAIKFFDSKKLIDQSRKQIDFIFKCDPQSSNQNHIQLTIRDYGEGITKEQESKIFELFYRGGSELTRSTQGTGIGLALVNELILAQQGTIQVQRMDPGLAMNILFKVKKLTNE